MATAYLDLNAYPDLRSFAAAFAQTTCRSLESNKDKLLKIFAGLQMMRPKVSVGADGSVSGSLEVVAGEKEALPALQEGMRHAEALARKAKRKLAVIIDEFSDLEKYNGPSVEKALRAEIQQQAAIGYIFSGSEESVMLSMVRDRKRAFYRLGRIMELGPIQREAYILFIEKWFRKGAYEVNRDDLEKILDKGKQVPLNVQRLCHTLWEKTRERKKVTPALVEELPFAIARQDSPHFELLWHSASPQQKNLLMALSKEPDAKPFSKDFQLTYGIGAVFFHKGVSGIPGEERNPGQGQRWVLSILGCIHDLLDSIYDAARPMMQRLGFFAKLICGRSGGISNGKKSTTSAWGLHG